MTDQPTFDRFSMPGEIPDASDPRWQQAGFDPLAEQQRRREEQVRGYAMRSGAGRGWEVAAVQTSPEEPTFNTPYDAGQHDAPERGLCSDVPRRVGRPPLLTPERQALFCEHLAHHGNVRLACRALGISSQTAYRARRSSAAMRACWDAALVMARPAVEEVLADRAINGVEEAVFYHGEEVATRRRYDSRLLLAHLARLDARAAVAEAEVADAPETRVTEATFDAALDALEEGREFAPEPCSTCSRTTAEGGGEEDAAPAPCATCGGACDDPDALLSPEDCMWLGNRLDRMDAARPGGAAEPRQLARDLDHAGQIEMWQLHAYEAGLDEWWLLTSAQELEERLNAAD